MAKGRRRGIMRGSREVVESRLRIGMPGTLMTTPSKGARAHVDMKAASGRLMMEVSTDKGTHCILVLSGIELHTALHALGFVRLNDRCGQG